MVVKIRKSLNYNDIVTSNSNFILDGLLAYLDAICFSYLDNTRNPCTYPEAIFMFLLLIIVAYPIRLAGTAIVGIVMSVDKSTAKVFAPIEDLIGHSICVSVFLITLLLGTFAFSHFTGSKKHSYIACLLISSCVWTPLLYLLAFHTLVKGIGSAIIGMIMKFYVSNNIRLFIYTPKDARESQLLFILSFLFTILLNVTLVSIY